MVKNLKTIRMCALNILNEKRTKISPKNLNADHTSHIHSYKAFYHSILKSNNVAALITVRKKSRVNLGRGYFHQKKLRQK
jgi:hypothetical protein